MSAKIALVVKFDIKPEYLNKAKSELLKILEPTRKEDGCLLYELHQDLDNPNVLMFYEIWETKEAWNKHDLMPHINKFREATKDCFESINVNKLSII